MKGVSKSEKCLHLKEEVSRSLICEELKTTLDQIHKFQITHNANKLRLIFMWRLLLPAAFFRKFSPIKASPLLV